MAGRKSDFTLPTLDDLFSTQEMRDDAKLAKIRDIPLELITRLMTSYVSPHILRHTKAMHLLEAGINIFYIKDLLGHEDISTTEVYAKASIETQRRALEKHSLVMPPATPSWVTNTDTLEWLKTLGK